MSRCIICTVGTSILTNRSGGRPWAGWNHRNPTPLPAPEEVVTWMKGANPVDISAETNTLSRLDLGDTDVLVFLYTDTKEGKFCAERLKEYYDKKVKEIKLKKIGSLGYGAHQFSTGLKALVDVVIESVNEAERAGTSVLFCATGGFKAEIAFLNLIGAMLGVEVVYIHELHRELVWLPRLPVTWDFKFVEQNRDFFEWIDEEPRKTEEVESWLKGRPELRPLVEDSEDGYTFLSPAGDLLFRVAKQYSSMGPRATWPESDPKPPEKKNFLSSEEHDRPVGWEAFVRKLCAIDCVSAVRYEARPEYFKGQRVKELDPQKGVLLVRYERGDKKLPLRVETTARGSAQLQLVADYIRRKFVR